MRKQKLLSCILALGLALTSVVPGIYPNHKAGAEEIKSTSENTADTDALQGDEIALDKSALTNPVSGYDDKGDLIYGGDPSVLVDGDTVYLYTGHDSSTDAQVANGTYVIKEWVCYSTKDMKNWKYEGPIMNAGSDIGWTSDASGSSGWASQVAKHYNSKAGKYQYYFYYCTWDKTAAGKQSIGVAVSDSPKGPFKDLGKPLVQGTVTEPQSSDWNDIDPTVWIEKDSAGAEHRYLAWGNSICYLCELNDDMTSVKDVNGDGKITCGTSAKKADIVQQSGLDSYTEAPWLYRRQNTSGNYYGKYYLFYAYGWREQLGYATTDDLSSGKWKTGNVLMAPTATSNTNHEAVFDFKGKTYFVYHNGSLPGGNGFRRSACIAELQFNEDGSVKAIPETASGLYGTTSQIYTNSGKLLSHKNYVNSSSDGDYPYLKVKVGAGTSTASEDAKWVLVAGKADKSKAAYASIQSENKPGLYLTANSDKTVTLAQDTDASSVTAKKQTFRTIKGLDNANGVSFESVSTPGYYLTIQNGTLGLTNGTDKTAATFYMNVDQNDTSLRSIAATISKTQYKTGDKINSKDITLVAAYANGTSKKVTNFTTDIAKVSTAKEGTKTIEISYTEGSVTKTTTVQVNVIKKIAGVTKLKASVSVAGKSTSIKLSWKGVTGARGYEVYYSTKKNKGYEYLEDKSATSFKYVDTEKLFKKKRSYYFYVRAYRYLSGKMDYSDYVGVKVYIK